MKKLMLLACGLIIAFAQTKLSAQPVYGHDDDYTALGAYNDTLFLKLQDGNKILISGLQFKELVKYTKADSLKLLFMTDYDRAITDQTLPADASLIHYFVHSSGKRRLKAETAEYSENKVDIGYEVTRLNLDLPKYQYLIHDLATGCTISIYMTKPDQIKQVLETMSINDAIAEVAKDKDIYSKFSQIELTHENSSYRLTGKKRHGQDMFQVTPSFGIGVIGTAVTPVAGADLTLILNDKYGMGKYKMGLGLTGFPLVDISGGEVKNIRYVKSYDAKFLVNLNKDTRNNEYWLGGNVGILESNISSLNHLFKAGIEYEAKGPFNYTFDMIFYDYHHSICALTVRLPF